MIETGIAMSLQTFQSSAVGRRIGVLLSNEAVIQRMQELSRLGRPAVGAIDEQLAGLATLDHTERQYVGRWVKDVMTSRGWKANVQRRIAGGKVLTSGMIYVRSENGRSNRYTGMPADMLPIAERVARAQTIIRNSGITNFSIDSYLVEKWAEADAETARLDAVGA